MVSDSQNSAFHRLGKRDLGPHAFEERMPSRIADLLQQDDGKSSVLPNVIPKLASLLERDSNVKVAYLCSPTVEQISKLKKEGAHFCGYRNIQMMCSALNHPYLSSRSGIFELQGLIEKAWDGGINSHGRIQTGGIRGTRKHIGTSEAEALLLSLDVACSGNAFQGKGAWKRLLDFVEAYFQASLQHPQKSGVHQTNLCPIFMQRPKHSLTVVGLERTRSGRRRLFVFDPAWQAPSQLKGPLQTSHLSTWALKASLRRYRKSQRYLKRFNAFETLSVDQGT